MSLWMEKGSQPQTDSEIADLDAITALKQSSAIELKVRTWLSRRCPGSFFFFFFLLSEPHISRCGSDEDKLSPLMPMVDFLIKPKVAGVRILVSARRVNDSACEN